MVFFSYSRGNLRVVRAIAAELRRLGYRTWLDLENLQPGQRWKEAIDRAMADSQAMVYCVSRLSLESTWTGVELRAAQQRGLPVVPLVVDDVEIDRLPEALRELHLISPAGWSPQELPRCAAEAIARSVGRPPLPGPWPTAASTEALQVQLRSGSTGETDAGSDARGSRSDDPATLAGHHTVTVGWTSPDGTSTPVPLGCEALAELMRAADDARGAEVFVDAAVDPGSVALVLGALAARVGPARIRLHGDASTARALAGVAEQVQATVHLRTA